MTLARPSSVSARPRRCAPSNGLCVCSRRLTPSAGIRCPVTSEAEELGFSARHLLYGKGRGLYRIIFDIREEERHVRVLRIWHGSRDAITAADAED